MKRALVVRHVAYEGVAGFAAPIEAAGHAIEIVDAGASGFDAIDLAAPDLLVLMGGPMAVYEQEAHRWMPGELARLADRLARDLPTIGVCLGSQLIAAALGGKVAPGPVREVGFAPIELTDEGRASPLAGLAGVPLLHWHGDVFEVPPGATLLARTDAAPQAFAKGRILALQCHPEMGDPADPIARWCEDEAYIAGAGTDPATIRADYERHGPAAVAAGRVMLGEWLESL